MNFKLHKVSGACLLAAFMAMQAVPALAEESQPPTEEVQDVFRLEENSMENELETLLSQVPEKGEEPAEKPEVNEEAKEDEKSDDKQETEVPAEKSEEEKPVEKAEEEKPAEKTEESADSEKADEETKSETEEVKQPEADNPLSAQPAAVQTSVEAKPVVSTTYVAVRAPVVKTTRATEEQIERYVKPDFSNVAAYGVKNPYTYSWTGQCTWYTWGRFFEVYGYSPGFVGNGCDCAAQLVLSHPDKWEFADKPVVGSIFSADYEHNHVGMIVGIEKTEDGADLYIVQEGNLDQRNNTMDEVEDDCWTQTYTMEELKSCYGNVIFANPKQEPDAKLLRTDVESEEPNEESAKTKNRTTKKELSK
jgi:outer membrane biosynthesis protein TonB